MALRFSEVSCFQARLETDRYFKHCGHFKLLDWEQFLQQPIYTGGYFIRVCRCCGTELEQSQHPFWAHRLLQLPQMGNASLEHCWRPRSHKGKQWGCASPLLFWMKSFNKGPCRSHLSVTSSNIKTAQRDAEGILHLHENIGVPQLLQTHCCLLPSTHQKILILASTRMDIWGDVERCHGIQSRLEGYDCINIEYGMLSMAWYTALKRKGMCGHGTVTIWKAKQEQHKSFMRQRNQSSHKEPNTTWELWGWGSKAANSTLEALWGKAVNRVIEWSDCFQFHPVRSQAVETTTWKTCMDTGKAAAIKLSRMALSDQEKNAKEISNSPPNFTPRGTISVGCQALIAFVLQPEPVRKPEPLDLWGKSLPRWNLYKGYWALPVNCLAPLQRVK